MKYTETEAVEPATKKEISARAQYKKMAEKKTRKFIKYVKAFIQEKNNGVIPNEWQCSIMMLETYYSQFLQITAEMNAMESIIVPGRYGAQVTSLMGAQQTCCVRIESILDKFGLTMKSSKNLKINDTDKDSPLAQWVNNKQDIEKR